MSYDNEQRRISYGAFRNVMDIGMGFLYALVGAVLIYWRATAKVPMPDFLADIPSFIVYLLGAMMVIGGLFRFYRGIKEVSRNKRRSDLTRTDE